MSDLVWWCDKCRAVCTEDRAGVACSFDRGCRLRRIPAQAAELREAIPKVVRGEEVPWATLASIELSLLSHRMNYASGFRFPSRWDYIAALNRAARKLENAVI